MSEGNQQTGISNTVYNLTSVFYHAAKGGTVYAQRAQKAKELLDAR